MLCQFDGLADAAAAQKKFKSPPTAADIVSESSNRLTKIFEQPGQTHRNFSDKERQTHLTSGKSKDAPI
ncbi:MAG: hypothetical protein SR1Q7_03060 [Quinella sp. 1Q7]|nr:hypothetical protein [Quinella sp. 1Q7]